LRATRVVGAERSRCCSSRHEPAGSVGRRGLESCIRIRNDVLARVYSSPRPGRRSPSAPERARTLVEARFLPLAQQVSRHDEQRQHDQCEQSNVEWKKRRHPFPNGRVHLIRCRSNGLDNIPNG
jgi:hypothetical protein